MPVTEYIWDDVNDCVLEECDETGATQVTYTHEPGPHGPLLSETRNGVESYHHYDALGSTTMLTDDSGAITDTFQYDAWGNLISRTGTTPTPYQWCGRWGYQFDEATGEYYVRERPFEPKTARWTSIDPMWIQTLLAYVYAGNRPVSIIDPSGRQAEEITVSKELACPFPQSECGCKGEDCQFEINARFRAGTVELCFRQGPEQELPDDPGRTTQTCTPEINRTADKNDHFTIVLADGTACKFTRDVMPPNDPFPPDWNKLPAACRDIIRRDEERSCYVSTKLVKKIIVRFKIDISCGCSITVDGVEHLITNDDSITLDGTLPKGK